MPQVIRHILGLVVLLVAWAGAARAEPAYPAFSAPVVDAAHVLSNAQNADLTRRLLDLQTKTGIQFAVATVPTLDGLEIEPYANGLFRNWKLGQKGVNNGLLLILAPKERKLRFEVGYGLEGAFTDLQSKLILHNTMVPKLKAGDPAGALTAGAEDAITVLTSDKAALPDRLKAPAPDDGSGALIAFAMIVLFVIVIFVVARRRGGSFWSGWTTGAFIGGSTGGSWSSGGSSGGDSFSGGGGGDSGGGGSSDSY